MGCSSSRVSLSPTMAQQDSSLQASIIAVCRALVGFFGATVLGFLGSRAWAATNLRSRVQATRIVYLILLPAQRPLDSSLPRFPVFPWPTGDSAKWQTALSAVKVKLSQGKESGRFCFLWWIEHSTNWQQWRFLGFPVNLWSTWTSLWR